MLERPKQHVYSTDAYFGHTSQLHERRTARQPRQMGELYPEKPRDRLQFLSRACVWMLVLQLQSCLALGGTHTFDGTNLNDGLTISRCLSQLAPATFTAEWSQKIISETAGNWRLKVSLLASGGG